MLLESDKSTPLSGRVMDADGTALPGVSIFTQDMPLGQVQLWCQRDSRQVYH